MPPPIPPPPITTTAHAAATHAAATHATTHAATAHAAAAHATHLREHDVIGICRRFIATGQAEPAPAATDDRSG